MRMIATAAATKAAENVPRLVNVNGKRRTTNRSRRRRIETEANTAREKYEIMSGCGGNGYGDGDGNAFERATNVIRTKGEGSVWPRAIVSGFASSIREEKEI